MSSAHFNVETGSVDVIGVVVEDGLSCRRLAGGEALRHAITPDDEAQGDDHCRDDGQGQTPDADQNIKEQLQEGILQRFEANIAKYLATGHHEERIGRQSGEDTESPIGPLGIEHSVLLPPFANGEEQTVATAREGIRNESFVCK